MRIFLCYIGLLDCAYTYEKTTYVRMVVNRPASDIDLRTCPVMYSSALYGNPYQHVDIFFYYFSTIHKQPFDLLLDIGSIQGAA